MDGIVGGRATSVCRHADHHLQPRSRLGLDALNRVVRALHVAAYSGLDVRTDLEYDADRRWCLHVHAED